VKMLNHEFSCQMRRLLIAFTQGKAILASTATSGNDLRHWPRSFQLCGKTHIRATHRFSKTAFAFFFLTRYHVLSYPSWKRSFARLRVSLLRKNKKMRGFFRKKNCWISAPSSVFLRRERSCFMDALRDLSWCHCFLNIYSFIYLILTRSWCNTWYHSHKILFPITVIILLACLNLNSYYIVQHFQKRRKQNIRFYFF